MNLLLPSWGTIIKGIVIMSRFKKIFARPIYSRDILIKALILFPKLDTTEFASLPPLVYGWYTQPSVG